MGPGPIAESPPPPPPSLLKLMAGGEENAGEGSLGERLPPSPEPPQPLAEGFPEEQPQPGPPHREDEQEEDGEEEEESERSEVQLRAPQLLGEGCVLVRELLFPPSVWMWGKEGGVNGGTSHFCLV